MRKNAPKRPNASHFRRTAAMLRAFAQDCENIAILMEQRKVEILDWGKVGSSAPEKISKILPAWINEAHKALAGKRAVPIEARYHVAEFSNSTKWKLTSLSIDGTLYFSE